MFCQLHKHIFSWPIGNMCNCTVVWEWLYRERDGVCIGTDSEREGYELNGDALEWTAEGNKECYRGSVADTVSYEKRGAAFEEEEERATD